MSVLGVRRIPYQFCVDLQRSGNCRSFRRAVQNACESGFMLSECIGPLLEQSNDKPIIRVAIARRP